MNRNLLILGTLTIFTLGSLGIFLASREVGNNIKSATNIRNEVLNNSYFTNLIASGAATRKDLEAMNVIMAYGNTFIGISTMSVNWSKGNDLAQRAGGEMLDITGETAAFKGALTEWLATNFIPDLHIPAWLQEAETPRIFDGQEILAVTVTDRRRRFWFGGIPL